MGLADFGWKRGGVRLVGEGKLLKNGEITVGKIFENSCHRL
jgi:hypothetical protein